VPKSKKVVTKVRNGHLKSGHQIRNWSTDQKLVTRSEKYSNLGLAAEFDPKLDDFLNQTTKNKITSLD
jgi:hypothetical protein